MKPSLRRVWHWARWPLGVLSVAYVVLVLYRAWAIGEEEKTQQAVARIHAQKITLADVMGENLPPLPNPQENDATVEGVDANNNGIRDDVELAIFEKYPDSPRVRAGQLQYALALQMELTQVFNSETLVATVQEENRSFFCISDGVPSHLPTFDDLEKFSNWLNIKENKERFNSENKRISSVVNGYIEEVKELSINTEERKKRYEEVYAYMTSYGEIGEKPHCDVEPVLLEK